MNLISRLTLYIAFVSRLSSVFCSIHFDEVEFYDPNKTLDESNSNGFECAHLGQECQITAQCCGVATCALPSWSANPVCLVPGYKHDERFRKRFLSVHHLRPEDIRYIRDSYNTSQYDFLLADLTFSAPPLNASANSSGTLEEVANVKVYNGTLDNFGDVDVNRSLVSSSADSLINNNQTENDSLVDNFDDELEGGTNESMSLSSNYSIYDNHEIHGNIVKNSTNSSWIGDLGFKSHFMFLMVNNTLRQNDPELDVKAFYDQVLNTDKFKNIVKQLKEKMKTLNELENRLNTNTETATFLMSNDKIETVKSTTETILSNQTTQRPSRWNIIKRFILHSKGISNSTNNFTNKKEIFNINNEENEISPKEKPILKKKESVKGKSSPQNENPSGNEGFKKIMEDVDKIEEIIDRDRRINEVLEPGTMRVNGDDQIDFYNIDVPLASLEALSEKNEGMNNSLESVFKDIGDTIKLMITDTDDTMRSELNQSLVEKNTSTQDNYIQNKQLSVSNESAMATSWSGSNKTHFWNKIHFWRVPQNFSAEFEKSLKNLFGSKKKSGMTLEESNQTHLNELYLLNLNSKNSQDTTQIKEEPVEHTSELSYVSYSESDSTSAEELYNDSYVFMVNKKQSDEPVKLTSWKRVLNLFHTEKLVPLSLDVDVNENLEGNSGDSECNPVVEVPEIIRLPEYLMPEALEERQRNETNWMFEDSDDLEDRPVELHKSSNSSFFFFFK